MTLTFHEEPFNHAEEEIRALVYEHWLEITSHRDTMPLSIHWSKYHELDALGSLVTIAARDEGKQLVGYVIFILYAPLHYDYMKWASDDAHFLKKEYRKGPAGLRMLKFAEASLRGRVDAILFHTKARSEVNKGRVFEKLGYKHHEQIYLKMME